MVRRFEDIDIRPGKIRPIGKPTPSVPAPKAANVDAPKPAPIKDVGLEGGTGLLDDTAKRDLGDVDPNAGGEKKLKEYERLSEDSRKLAEDLGGLTGKKKEIEKQLEALKKFPRVGMFRGIYLVREKALKDQLKKVDGQIAETTKRRDAVENRMKDLREAVVNNPLPVDGNGANDPRFEELENLHHKKVDLAQKLNGAEGALKEAEKQLDQIKKFKATHRHPIFQRHYDKLIKNLEKKVADLKGNVEDLKGKKGDLEKRLEAVEHDILTNPENFLNPPSDKGDIEGVLKEVGEIEGQIKSDQTKLEGEKAKLAEVEARRKAIADKIGDIEKKIDELSNANGGLKADKENALAELKATKAALQAEEKKLAALKAEKEAVIADQNGLSEERRELIDYTADHKDEYNFLKALPPEQLSENDKKFLADYESKTARIGAIGEKIKAANARIAEIDKKIGELTDGIKDKTSQIGELEKKIKDIDSKIAANDAAIKLAKEALENSKRVLGLVDKQIDKVKGEIGKLEKEIADLGAKRNAILDKAIKGEGKEIAADKAAIDQIDKRLGELEKAKEAKQAELSKLIAERDGHLKKIEDLEKKIGELEKANGALKGEKGALKAEIDKLQGEIKGMLGQIKDLSAEKAKLIGDQNKLSERRMALFAERDKVLTKEQYDFLKGLPEDQLSPSDKAKIAQYDGITKEIENIGNKIADLNRRKGEIDAEIKDLQGKVSASKAKVAENEGKIGEIDKKLAANEKEIKGLRDSIAGEKKAIGDLDGKISAAKIAIARIVGRIDALEKKKDAWVKKLEEDTKEKETLEERRAADPTKV